MLKADTFENQLAKIQAYVIDTLGVPEDIKEDICQEVAALYIENYGCAKVKSSRLPMVKSAICNKIRHILEDYDEYNSRRVDQYHCHNAISMYSYNLKNQDVIDQEVLREYIKLTLTPRELYCIELRFGFYDGNPRTLQEISDVFRVGKERVREICNKAMRKINKNIMALYGVYFIGCEKSPEVAIKSAVQEYASERSRKAVREMKRLAEEQEKRKREYEYRFIVKEAEFDKALTQEKLFLEFALANKTQAIDIFKACNPKYKSDDLDLVCIGTRLMIIKKEKRTV